jgi:hypothetical protein
LGLLHGYVSGVEALWPLDFRRESGWFLRILIPCLVAKFSVKRKAYCGALDMGNDVGI